MAEERKAEDWENRDEEKVERKGVAGVIDDPEVRRHLIGPSVPGGPEEGHMLCRHPWHIISDKSTTKMQTCKISDLGTVLFHNDRVEAAYGVKEENLPVAKDLLKRPLKEILEEYPLDT